MLRMAVLLYHDFSEQKRRRLIAEYTVHGNADGERHASGRFNRRAGSHQSDDFINKVKNKVHITLFLVEIKLNECYIKINCQSIFASKPLLFDDRNEKLIHGNEKFTKQDPDMMHNVYSANGSFNVERYEKRRMEKL